jgi:hypothetical protein
MEKIYLDTSVFGGYFDAEFEVWTKILFDKIIAGEYKILYSRLIDIELASAPEKVREFVDTQIEFVDISEEAIKLAEQYLNENIVGKTSRADGIHIAIATLNNADMLVSWNFKHIVNLNRIRGYNSVNQKYGHKTLEIRTPREILEYEE